MKDFLKTKIWPVVAGFASASAAMMIFEYTNSLLFPFPPGFDDKNIDQVRGFILSAPDSIYILVMMGWFSGGVVGSWVIYKLVKDLGRAKNLIIILAVLLTVGGMFNNYFILQGLAPWWVNLYGLLIFPLVAICFIKYKLK